MTEPYFKGQEAAECGHYYPDVLRLGDIRVGEDIIREVDCKYCGRYSEKLDFEYKGNDIGILTRDEDIPDVRAKALERLLNPGKKIIFHKPICLEYSI